MRTYEVTQALLTPGTLGAAYQVRARRNGPVLYTVCGVPESRTPSYRLLEGEQGGEVAHLTGDFIKTEYEVHAGARRMARLVFPAVAFKTTLTLTIGDDVYEADGGVFHGVFQCKAKDGEVVLEIAKELSIRDTFSVKASEALPQTVGILVAVAIHSRFYEMV